MQRFGGWTVLVFLFAVTVCVGCGSGGRSDPILALGAEESLERGQALMEEEKWAKAREYLEHAFEVEPNSASGREALLLAADSLYLQGGSGNLVQAEAKYRDFLNRFPTSDRIPYVMLQIGKSLAERVEKPDRDQSVTREAITALEELIRIYPGSPEAEEARENLQGLRNLLAEHEFEVARFYFRYGLSIATISRLDYLLENYPAYPDKDKVYYYLGLAHTRRGNEEEAESWFDKLRSEYPTSEFVAEIPETADRPEGDEEG